MGLGYGSGRGGPGQSDKKGDKKPASGYPKQLSETISTKQGQMLKAAEDLSQDKFLMMGALPATSSAKK
jgi:hypothetical protein